MPDGSLAEWVADGLKIYYVALSDHTKAYFEGKKQGEEIIGIRTLVDLQTGLRSVKKIIYQKNKQGMWFEANPNLTFENTEQPFLLYWPATNNKIMIPQSNKFEFDKDISGTWYSDTKDLIYYFQDKELVIMVHPLHIVHAKLVRQNRIEGLEVRWWGGCRTEMAFSANIISSDTLLSTIKGLDANCDLPKGFTGGSRVTRNRLQALKDSIYIHTFRIFDKIQSINPTEYNQKSYKLDYAQNFITFEFESANPSYPLLWYKLEGFDHDWFQTRTTKSANYTNLDGGDYTFMVKATAEDGSDMGQSTSFKLHVSSPYYRTWWFYSLCLLSIGAIFYFIFRNRELQRLRQEQLRLRIARDLHDEVGSTLSSISILSQASLQGLEQDINKARFSNIGDKSRVALDSISDIVWSINPENDSLEKILSRMSAYASDMLEHGGTTLSFHIDEKLETYKLPMEKRKDFYLLFKEAINNIAKHALAKSVTVSLSKDKNGLILNIKDNGIGFETKVENKMNHSFGGNGLKNMQSRAKAIGAILKINSISGTGTEIQLVLPAF